jgi:hypothetical protein
MISRHNRNSLIAFTAASRKYLNYFKGVTFDTQMTWPPRQIATRAFNTRAFAGVLERETAKRTRVVNAGEIKAD